MKNKESRFLSRLLLTDREEYAKMAHASNPYGNGYACEWIAGVLEYGSCLEAKHHELSGFVHRHSLLQ